MRQRFNERKIIGFIFLGLAAVALFTLLVMSLWNAILVPVLHVGAVSFWQAAGILVLSKILFGGFKGRGGGPWGGRGRHFKYEMREKWANMSPEEKDKMKQEWRHRCNMWKNRDYDNNDARFTGSEAAETK